MFLLLKFINLEGLSMFVFYFVFYQSIFLCFSEAIVYFCRSVLKLFCTMDKEHASATYSFV